jgi:hypothetical protein
MTDDREVFRVRRDAGLAKRHEIREARAIRRQVAEEIAQALEGVTDRQDSLRWLSEAMRDAARIAREIGTKEATP